MSYTPAVVTPLPSLQNAPAVVHCPCCNQVCMTRVEGRSGGTTHAWAALLCCCLCLGCIPYLMNSLKDQVHRCSMCNAQLATWYRSGRIVVNAQPVVPGPALAPVQAPAPAQAPLKA